MSQPRAAYILLLVIHSVFAGYEHTCSVSDYEGGGRGGGGPDRLQMCGSSLTRFIERICPNGILMKRDVSYVSGRSGYRALTSVPKDVGVERTKAHSMLSVNKRYNSGANGIVCECCVHRCSMPEMKQYCAPARRRRRSVRPAVTQADVDRFYERLDSMQPEEMEEASGGAQSFDDFERQPLVRLLEKYKQINIAIAESQESSGSDELPSLFRQQQEEEQQQQQQADRQAMSEFLKESLLNLLAKSRSERPADHDSSRLTDQENQDMHSLWELFKNELQKPQ